MTLRFQRRFMTQARRRNARSKVIVEQLESRTLLAAVVDGYDFPFPDRDKYCGYADPECYGSFATAQTQDHGNLRAGWGYHSGDDVAGGLAIRGMPVVAIANGVIIDQRVADPSESGCGSVDTTEGTGCGNAWLIAHTERAIDGTTATRYSLYAHLCDFAPGLTKESEVQRGQVIGYVGSTGKSSGDHLHFETKDVRTFGFGYYPTGIPQGYYDPSEFIAEHRPPKNTPRDPVTLSSDEHVRALQSGSPQPISEASTWWRIVAERAGALTLQVRNLLGDIVRGAVSFFDHLGQQLQPKVAFAATERPNWVLQNVQVGDEIRFAISESLVGPMNFVSWTQDVTQIIDPADHRPPAAPITDDFGDRYEDAVPLLLDSRRFASRSGMLDGNNHVLTADRQDHDWFLVTAKRDGPMLIEATNLNLNVRVHGPDSKTLKVDSDPDPAIALLDVRAGQSFRIDVGPNAPGVTGEYTLQVSQPGLTQLAGQPDDGNTDTGPGPLPGWGGVRGVQINMDPGGQGDSREWIRDPGDVKWFQINNLQPRSLQVTVTGGGDLVPGFIVFGSDGGGRDSASQDGRLFARSCVDVTNDANAGKPVIVAVQSHEGRSTGPFTIEVRQPDVCSTDDHGNTNVEATPLDTDDHGNGSITGRIDHPADEDWFRIPLKTAGTGHLIIQVSQENSTLVSFLTTQQEGCDNTDSGEDGEARTVCFPTDVVDGDTVFARVTSADGSIGPYRLTVWRATNPDDDHPDSIGDNPAGRPIRPVVVRGRLEFPGDKDAFQFRATRPGPVGILGISQTQQFTPAMHWSRHHPDADRREGTDGGSGRGGRTFAIIPDVLAAPDNWLNIEVLAGGQHPFGDYLLYVWQPQHPADIDPDTFGVEASPAPVHAALDAGLEFAGDKDVFRVDAKRTGPLTIDVMPPAGGNDGIVAFLTVYDATGRSIGTGAETFLPDGRIIPGSSSVTVEAQRGQTFYAEVAAIDGADTGPYFLNVTQPLDDHRDSGVNTVRLLEPSPLGTDQAVGTIETVGDRDVFNVLAPIRGMLTIDVQALPPVASSWVGTTQGTASVVQGTTVAETVTVDGRVIRPRSVVPAADGSVTVTADGGALGRARQYNDLNIATARLPVDVTSSASLDIAGRFGATHNMGHVSLTDGTNVIQVEFRRLAFGGPMVIWVRFSGYVALENVAPIDNTTVLFPENAEQRLSFADQNGEIRVMLGSTLLARFQGELVPNARLEALAWPTGAPDRFAELAIRDVIIDGVLTTTPMAATPTLDTVVRVFDENGHLVASDDDGGDGRNSQVSFPAFQGIAYAMEVSGYGDVSIGSYAVQVRSETLPQHTIVDRYDDFTDRRRDAFRWEDHVPVKGRIDESRPDRADLELFADGDGAPDNNTAATRTRGTITGGLSVQTAVVLGPEVHNRADIELRTGNDPDPRAGSFIRVTFVRQENSGPVFASLSTQGYDVLTNLGPQAYPENAGFPWDIQEVDNGSRIEISARGIVVATLRGPLAPGSHFWARSVTAGGPGRFARLNINNVSVDEAHAWIPEPRLIDAFDDNTIDRILWTTTGDVTEANGRLTAWLYRNGKIQHSTAVTGPGAAPGHLRGVTFNADRFGERVGPGQAESWVAITNGNDFLRLRWLNDVNQMIVQANGYYGSGLLHRWDPGAPGSDDEPDGPFAIWENGNHIEIVHNHRVVYTLANRSILPGSYVELHGHGATSSESGQSLRQQMGLSIDDLQFLYDPEPVRIDTPELTSTSDAGVSNTDHITNDLTPTFEWTQGSHDTRYQWREGELRDDGSVQWTGAWSTPQTPNSATVALPHTSVHVFSVREVSRDGIVSEPSSRGFIVDVEPPVLGNMPEDRTVEATGPGGALVTYAPPTATDLEGDIPIVPCIPASGSLFPLGTTRVECTATDIAGNTDERTSKVTVIDTTPPVLTVPPVPPVEAVGPSGAIVSFVASAVDLVDGNVPVNCTRQSGSFFPLGRTDVECTATDARGNTARRGFSVTVLPDRHGPTIDRVELVKDENGSVTKIVLTFNEDVNVEAAESVRNYILHIRNGRRAKAVKLADVAYNTATHTVTLAPRAPIPASAVASATLTVKATRRFTDIVGNILNGDGDNRPGGSFVQQLSAASSRSTYSLAVDAILERHSGALGLLLMESVK